MQNRDKGQYKLRLELPLYDWVVDQAKQNERSINAEISFHLKNAQRSKEANEAKPPA